MTALTENGAVCYTCSGSHLVDCFYNIIRNTNKDRSLDLWKKAIEQDPYKAFQIAMFTRDCRGGKGEKQQTYYFLEYIKQYYPKTYELCLPDFIEVGYYKDLLMMYILKPTGEVELKIFADQLQKDLKILESPDGKKQISLASKYAPS